MPPERLPAEPRVVLVDLLTGHQADLQKAVPVELRALAWFWETQVDHWLLSTARHLCLIAGRWNPNQLCRVRREAVHLELLEVLPVLEAGSKILMLATWLHLGGHLCHFLWRLEKNLHRLVRYVLPDLLVPASWCCSLNAALMEPSFTRAARSSL